MKLDKDTNKVSVSRRDFMYETGAAFAALTIVPSHVLGGAGRTPPSEKITLAGIGVGGVGHGQLQSCEKQKAQIVALCDVDDEYAGRSYRMWPQARRYRDYRKMLDSEKDIDTVYIGTPDHSHAVITMAALRKGKHVCCVKPLTRTIHESRRVVEEAQKAKVATQVTASANSTEKGCRTCEMIWDGAIGDVREVHIWSNRPLWPQGMLRPPAASHGKAPLKTCAVPQGHSRKTFGVSWTLKTLKVNGGSPRWASSAFAWHDQWSHLNLSRTNKSTYMAPKPSKPHIVLLRRSKMKFLNYICVLLLCLAATVSLSQAKEPIFVPVKIDGPVHDPANHSYWFGPFSECCSVLDVDGDGDLDIAAGRNWYEAPQWKKHSNFRDGAMTNGPETDDNSEFALDINRDGRTDVVSSGWMYMKGAFWYENPGKNDVKWKSTRIHLARSMEGIIHGDIDGDGDDDILVNHWTLESGQGVTWIESIDREPWLKEHIIGTKGDLHGNGLGDINGDGRTDIVTPAGWYEAPAKPTEGEWVFHADYIWKGPASHPILVHDVDEDGLNDIIIGAAHSYGLAWLEQVVDVSGKRSFTTHWIEKDFGQCHTMELGDLNGDGKPDLVTGKRLFAHHGSDVSAFDPLFAFWYDIQGGKFERHVLSFNHLPWYSEEERFNPPPNGAVAVGMKLNIVDLDKDGDNDIVIAGKTGLYVFYNKGYPPSPRHEHKLPPHDTYPTWRDWPGFKPLFNSKDLTGWKIPEGDNGHWKVLDRVIDYDAQSEASGNKSLWTEESFGDFRLLIEWRLKRTSGLYPMPTILPDGSLKKDADGKVITEMRPNADSGIMLRGTGKGQVNIWCWPVGSGEMWGVRNDKNLTPQLRAAAVPKVRADNPVGQWNLFDITIKGDRVTVILNGRTVIDNAQVPEIPEKGPIGLQHHGGLDKRTGKMGPASSLIQFRNVWIKEIK